VSQARRRQKRAAERNHPQTPVTPVPQPAAPTVSIGFVASAHAQFKTLPEKIQRGLLRKLKELALHPALGKPLIDDLQGCYRVTYGSYRCIVRMTDGIAMVLVLVIAKRKAGSRGDPYSLALDLLRKSNPSVEEIFGRYIRAYLEEQRRAAAAPIDIPATVKGHSTRRRVR